MTTNDQPNIFQRISNGIVALFLFTVVCIFVEFEGCYRENHLPVMQKKLEAMDFDIVVLRSQYDFAETHWGWISHNCDLNVISTFEAEMCNHVLYEIRPRVLPSHIHCPRYLLKTEIPADSILPTREKLLGIYGVFSDKDSAEAWLHANGYTVDFVPHIVAQDTLDFAIGFELSNDVPRRLGPDGRPLIICADAYFWYWSMGSYLCCWNSRFADRYVEKGKGFDQNEQWRYLKWLRRKIGE